MTVATLTDPEPTKFCATCPSCGTAQALVNPQWLRWARERAGLTLKQFSADVGLGQPYLSDIERGNRRCSPQLRARYEQLGIGTSAANTSANTSTSVAG